ncbi:hypothetical protein CDAR_294721 [Caerostris darwini]|uniref:Uncharacterized protein n=1 Tax=Caerostris darwini TaxID=1538125 RepID=A0AAV4ULC0_9ARAC|nr:hypothetical protein CDAR_294721 [Caerostris darwini]
MAPNATERSHHHPRNARPPTSPSELRWNVLSEHPSRSNGGPLVVVDERRPGKTPEIPRRVSSAAKSSQRLLLYRPARIRIGEAIFTIKPRLMEIHKVTSASIKGGMRGTILISLHKHICVRD